MAAMSVWPTDGADGSVANEARWRKMGRAWARSGIVPDAGGGLVPSLSMPNLTVQSGAAWVDGHYTELAGSQVITATANGLAVVRFDPAANTADLLWRDAVSVPAQNPTGTWELPIAKTVGSVLTDLRVSSAPGEELAYNQITANKSVTASSAAAPDIVVDGTSRTYDGTPIVIEFHAACAEGPGGAGVNVILFQLYDGAIDLGWLDRIASPAGRMGIPAYGRRIIRPTAGTHNYRVGAWMSPASPAGIVFAGPGTSADMSPAYSRVTRA